jgi:hypothetical protein
MSPGARLGAALDARWVLVDAATTSQGEVRYRGALRDS